MACYVSMPGITLWQCLYIQADMALGIACAMAVLIVPPVTASSQIQVPY